jgi:hypothetical protein
MKDKHGKPHVDEEACLADATDTGASTTRAKAAGSRAARAATHRIATRDEVPRDAKTTNRADTTSSTLRTIAFVVRHPIAALAIGDRTRGARNATSDAARIAARLGLQEDRKSYQGSEVNAMRHALWQSRATALEGAETAREIGEAHEDHPHAIDGLDPTKLVFGDDENGLDALSNADEAIDLFNNRIGREIGAQHAGATAKQLAEAVLERFVTHGLWVAQPVEDGRYLIVLSKLPRSGYAHAMSVLATLDEDGFSPAEDERQQEIDQITAGLALK